MTNMKKFFTLFALFSVMSAACAGEAGDTIVNVLRAGEVLLTESDSTLHLRIRGCDRDTAYRFDYRRETGRETATLLEERSRSWDFSFPLARKSGKCSSKEFTMGGIGFGFVTAHDAPREMDVDMSASYEIFADLFGILTSFRDRAHEFSVGMGIDWRNYRLTGKKRFVKETNDVVVTDYPEDVEIQFSRIKVFSLTFPFRYQYNVTKKFSVNAAAILNLNTYASIKTRYRQDGHKIKEMHKNIHQNPVTVDFMLGAQWRMVGIYAKYSPCDVLKKDFGPRFKSFSTGFVFFY